MSDLNTEILISANAEGVEAGVGRAKKSLSSLGDTAQKIGKNGADGMQALGAGADMSARKVESATKNMVGSLQRQIAAMEAGDKTSRKYQETLARMRGVDVAALKPYLDQLDSLQNKTTLAERAQASFNSVMLKGAVVFAAAGAIASYVKIINDGVDALNDLKDATGASIENISALEDVGKRAGASFDVVSTSLIKFNNVLSDAKPGSAAEQAIKALGLSIEDLKRLDPAEALRQTSVALNRFADDGDKARLVQELFGKSVKEVAPFLKDLAESGALVAKVTTEQAEQAEKFNKELSALGKNAQDASRALVGPMVSALNDVIAKFKEGREAGKSFLEIANSRYWSNIRDFYGMSPSAPSSTGGATGSWGDGPDIKPSVGPLPDTKKPKGPTKAELSDYDKLIQKLGVDLPKAAADAEAAQMGYNKAQAEFLALAGSDVWVKFTNSERARVAALFESKIASEQAADAARTLAKANLDAAQSREKYITSLATGLDKIQADIAAQIEATERMGLSKEAIAELDAAKLEMLATDLELQAVKAMDRNLDQQTYDALKKQAAAYRELGIAKKGGAAKEAALGLEKANAEAAKKAQEDWERAAEQINSSLTDALLRGFESGKDFAKNLRDTVVNMFKTMVLRPVISAIINPVAGALTGAMGLSGAAQAAGGISTAMSGASFLGNAAGILGGAGTAAGYGASALFAGNGLGALSGGFGMLTGGGGLGMAAQGAGMIAGVLGPIALGVGAVMALVKKLDDSGTMHTGALSQYSAAGGLANSTTHGAFGMGFGGVDYSAETEKFTGAMAQSIVMMLDSTATTFGKEAGYKAATAFADDTSKDGAWGGLLITKLNETIVNWDPSRTSKWAPKEFADGEAGSKEYLAEVAKSTRDALVGAIGDVDWATDMLTALGESPTLEGLAQTVQQINAAQAAFDALGKNIVGFGALTDGAISQLVKAAGSVEGLVFAASAYYDNFYSEAEKTANVTRDVAAALADVGLQMPTTRDEFRALVDSQLALGESGATAVAALFGVSGAFASVTAASETAAETAARLADEQGKAAEAAARAAEEAARRAEEIARERYGLETQIMQLLGDTAGLRMREIEALDASNRALQEHIYAIEDAREAYQKSITAANDAYSGLERSVAAEKTALQAQYELKKKGFSDTLKVQADANSAQVAAARAAADKIKGIASALQNALKSSRVDSPSINAARLSSARSTISGAAESNNLFTPGLESALAVAGADNKQFYGRFEDYAYAQGVTAGEIAKLSTSAQAQLSAAESIVSSLAAQNSVAQLISDAEMAALDEWYAQELKKLDDTLTLGKSQLDAMLGIDNSVLSVADAVANLENAINASNAALQAQLAAEAAARTAASGGGTTAQEGSGKFYTDSQGNRIEVQGGQSLQWWEAVSQSGVSAVSSLAELEQRLADKGKTDVFDKLVSGFQLDDNSFGSNFNYTTLLDSDGGLIANQGGFSPEMTQAEREAQIEQWAKAWKVPGFATGINRVPHDMLARIHKDEAVVPAAYNPYNPGASAPGNSEVVAELRKLNERMARIEASSNATAGHTAGTDRKLARVIRNDAMITEALPA